MSAFAAANLVICDYWDPDLLVQKTHGLEVVARYAGSSVQADKRDTMI